MGVRGTPERKHADGGSMNFTDVIKLLGGVAMFLYGMSLMGDSLKRVAGNKLELFFTGFPERRCGASCWAPG